MDHLDNMLGVAEGQTLCNLTARGQTHRSKAEKSGFLGCKKQKLGAAGQCVV